MTDELEERVQWLVDRAEISELLFSFASCLDLKDYASYAANFAEGGYVELPEPTSTTGETFRMPKDKMEELMPVGLSKYTATHHISTNHQIRIEGDEAVSRSYLQAVHIGSTPYEHWDGGGWYDCSYKRTSSGWKFLTVKLSVLWLTGAPQQMKVE